MSASGHAAPGRRKGWTVPVKLLLVSSGLLGAGLVLLETSRYGAGSSPDSAYYVSAARAAMSGNGFTTYDGRPLMLWPPGFPAALALAGSLVGMDPFDAARYVNAFSFGLIVAITGFWLSKRVGPLLSTAGVFAVLFSESLLWVSGYAWSETLFILLVTLFLVCSERYLQEGSRTALLSAGAFAASACLTRYIGVTAIAAGVALALTRRGAGPSRKVSDAALYSVAAVSPVALWAARNYTAGSNVTGHAHALPSMKADMLSFLNAFNLGFLPGGMPPSYKALALVALFVAVAAVIAAGLLKKGAGPGRITTVHLVLFMLVYGAGLFASKAAFAFDDIGARYISPLIVPSVMLLAVAFHNLWAPVGREGNRRLMGLALAGALSVFVGRQAVVGYGAVVAGRDTGEGFTSRQWRGSSLVRLLKNRPPKGRFYSNLPDAVYLLTGIPALPSPREYIFNSPTTQTEDLAELKRALADGGPLYLVWFSRYDKDRLDYNYSLRDLGTMFRLDAVEKADDGMLYRIYGRPDAGATRRH